MTGLCLTGISPAARRDSLEFFPWHTTKDGWRKQSEVLELSVFLCPWEAWPCWISRANACIIWGSWLSLLCSWLNREEWGREGEKETELALIKALQLSLIFTYCAIIIDPDWRLKMQRRKWHAGSPQLRKQKKGAAPSPFPHHSQPNQKPRKRNCAEALYKAQSSARAQSSTPPSTRRWAASGWPHLAGAGASSGFTRLVRCELFLWCGAGHSGEAGRAAAPAEGVWCCFLGLTEKLPMRRRAQAPQEKEAMPPQRRVIVP